MPEDKKITKKTSTKKTLSKPKVTAKKTAPKAAVKAKPKSSNLSSLLQKQESKNAIFIAIISVLLFIIFILTSLYLMSEHKAYKNNYIINKNIKVSTQQEDSEITFALPTNAPKTIDVLPKTDTTTSTPVIISPKTTVKDKAYVKNAKPYTLKPGYKYVSIVIDDVGVAKTSNNVFDLPKAITFAFLPYGNYTQKYAHQAFKNGHEIMVHIPMAPLKRATGSRPNPGPNALYIEDSKDEILRKTKINMDSLKSISIGANNHMGSEFTSNLEGMKTVLSYMENNGYFFLDSYTISTSKVKKAANGKNIPILIRDIFIDDSQDENKVKAELDETVKFAEKHGTAIAIGHPHPVTVEYLKKWIPTLEAKKIQLVPITALIDIQNNKSK